MAIALVSPGGEHPPILDFQITLPTGIDVASFYIVSTQIGNMTFQSTPFNGSPGATTNVWVPLVSNTPYPWGYKGTLNWILVSVSSGGQVGTGPLMSTTVEIYAVAQDLAPFYRNGGIPLQLLELFVLPTLDKSFTEINMWTEWVVQRCHASKLDPDCAVPIGERIHSYQYEANSGSKRFEHEPYFAIADWLKNLNSQTVIRVNCYDQAALVDYVLHLGYPAKLVDNKGTKYSPVVRVFRGSWGDWDKTQEFGFIQEKVLIGWGKCNNPFFKSENNDKVFGPTSTGKRSKFRNHKFVGIQQLDSSGNLDPSLIQVVDACAGPAAYPVPQADYFTDVIDSTASVAKWGSNFNALKPVILLGDLEAESATQVIKAVFDSNPSKRANPDPMPVPISEIEASLRPAISSAHPEVLQETFTVTSDDFSILPNGTSSIFDIYWADSFKPSLAFVTVQVDVMQSYSDAVQRAGYLLLTFDDGDFLTVPAAEEPYYGDIYFTCTEKNLMHLMIYGNICILVSGTDCAHSDMGTICGAIAGAMQPYENTPFTNDNQLDASSIVSELPTSVSANSTFNISFEVSSLQLIGKSILIHAEPKYLRSRCHTKRGQRKLRTPISLDVNMTN